MTDQIIVTLIAGVSGFAGVIVKLAYDKRTQRKENKVIADSLRENYAQNSNINRKQDADEAEKTFKRILKSKLQCRAAKQIIASKLDIKHKAIMMLWAEKIEDLAFAYYYNEYRGIAYEMKDFLEVQISIIEETITAKIKHDILESIIIKYDFNGEPVYTSFSEWIANENNRKPFIMMELLKGALEQNGFDNPQNEKSPNFTSTMDFSLKNILESYVKEVDIWHKLENAKKKSTPLDYKKLLE